MKFECFCWEFNLIVLPLLSWKKEKLITYNPLWLFRHLKLILVCICMNTQRRVIYTWRGEHSYCLVENALNKKCSLVSSVTNIPTSIPTPGPDRWGLPAKSKNTFPIIFFKENLLWIFFLNKVDSGGSLFDWPSKLIDGMFVFRILAGQSQFYMWFFTLNSLWICI